MRGVNLRPLLRGWRRVDDGCVRIAGEIEKVQEGEITWTASTEVTPGSNRESHVSIRRHQ